MEAIVQARLGALPTSGFVDLYAEYAHSIPASVVYALIGIPEAAWLDVQKQAESIVATLPEPTHELPSSSVLPGISVNWWKNGAPAQTSGMKTSWTSLFRWSGRIRSGAPEVMTHILQLVVASTDTTRACPTPSIGEKSRVSYILSRWESGEAIADGATRTPVVGACGPGLCVVAATSRDPCG